jgi:ABC-type microcin C transport system duplicated ATPase subunit YejF
VSGTIELDGRDLTGLSQRALRPIRRSVQMIYQDPYESLDPRLRVRQRSRSRS